MTLDDFLSAQRLTNAEFANLVGVDTTTILRVRKGKVNPSSKLMLAIYNASKGEVSPNDFVLPPLDRTFAQGAAA